MKIDEFIEGKNAVLINPLNQMRTFKFIIDNKIIARQMTESEYITARIFEGFLKEYYEGFTLYNGFFTRAHTVERPRSIPKAIQKIKKQFLKYFGEEPDIERARAEVGYILWDMKSNITGDIIIDEEIVLYLLELRLKKFDDDYILKYSPFQSLYTKSLIQFIVESKRERVLKYIKKKYKL